MKEKRESRESRLILFLGRIFGATFFFGLGLFLSFYLGFVFFENYVMGGDVVVPDFGKMNLVEALNRSTRLGLRLEVKAVGENPDLPPLVVLEQDPPPGARTKKNARLRVVVNGGALSSPGIPMISQGKHLLLPDVRGKSIEEAQSIFESQGFKVGRVVEVSHSTLPRGYVISQNPQPQTEVTSGSLVHLLVSAGRGGESEAVSVPDVVGLRLEEAREVLARSGLVVEEIEEVTSSNRPAGVVIEQSPGAQELLPRGGSVRLKVVKAWEALPPEEGAKSLTLRFVLPSSQSPITVQIVVQDETGERVVYEREHRGEDLVEISAPTKGKGKVTIFLNGYYYWEKTF